MLPRCPVAHAGVGHVGHFIEESTEGRSGDAFGSTVERAAEVQRLEESQKRAPGHGSCPASCTACQCQCRSEATLANGVGSATTIAGPSCTTRLSIPKSEEGGLRSRHGGGSPRVGGRPAGRHEHSAHGWESCGSRMHLWIDHRCHRKPPSHRGGAIHGLQHGQMIAASPAVLANPILANPFLLCVVVCCVVLCVVVCCCVLLCVWCFLWLFVVCCCGCGSCWSCGYWFGLPSPEPPAAGPLPADPPAASGPQLHTTTRELQTCTFDGPGASQTPPRQAHQG